ncbi:MAG: Asp-tRNA(Asn)/Glu-tRNA(Gln) amidotransferase GatCAB subunit B, partial [Patescibacteria group bacterium]|nr:Asp-tRNA(Asn)/Glu-tRNA(Gln) amidotransferase GatCAB subunit B [Patescibacteria group bacterium]
INYILTDYMGLLKKDHGEDYAAFIQTIEPKQFAALLEMIAENQLSSRGAKDLLAIMYQGDHREPGVIAEEMGLVQKNDEGALIKIVNEIIATHPTVVADYKSGKTVALQFLVGQGMKASKGSANPGILKKMFSELLSNV